jgi:hypothetical protein
LLILWNILTLYCLLLCRYFDVGISTSKYLPMFFKISHFALKSSFLTVCIWRLIVFCYTAVPLYVTLFLILNFRSVFTNLPIFQLGYVLSCWPVPCYSGLLIKLEIFSTECSQWRIIRKFRRENWNDIWREKSWFVCQKLVSPTCHEQTLRIYHVVNSLKIN